MPGPRTCGCRGSRSTGRPARPRATRRGLPTGSPIADVLAPADRARREAPVEREDSVPVVHDDEVPVALEPLRVDDLAREDRANRGARRRLERPSRRLRNVFGNFGFAMRPNGTATRPRSGQSSAPRYARIEAAPGARERPRPSRRSSSAARRSDLSSSVDTCFSSTRAVSCTCASSAALRVRAAARATSFLRLSAERSARSRFLAASSSSRAASVVAASSCRARREASRRARCVRSLRPSRNDAAESAAASGRRYPSRPRR